MSKEIKPTSSHILWGGAVEIHCFGRATGNWSLAGSDQNEAERNNLEIIQRMLTLKTQFGCELIFAPNPSEFNAKVVMTDELQDEWGFGYFFRGAKADGVVLRDPGTAFVVSSADCPTTVLFDQMNGRLCVAHAGRDSLIDRSLVENGAPSRYDRSVIDAMVKEVADPARMFLKAFVACGISPLAFQHPTNIRRDNSFNEKLVSYVRNAWGDSCALGGELGAVWLTEIIRKQLSAHGMFDSSIGSDGICTFCDKEPWSNEPLWHSHRRGDRTRNLVLVIRRF